MEINQGFFATLSDQISRGHFSLAEQNIFHIDEHTKKVDNMYVLSSDAVDIEGKILRAGKDRFSLENYVERQPGHKFLFIDEKNPDHIVWAKAQGKNATWYLKDPDNIKAPIKAPKGIAIAKAGQFIKSNFDISDLPSFVTLKGASYYVTKVNSITERDITVH